MKLAVVTVPFIIGAVLVGFGISIQSYGMAAGLFSFNVFMLLLAIVDEVDKSKKK